MAVQIGVQSGVRIGIHNHSTINQGGILYWAYRTPYRTGALAINCPNNAVTSTVSDDYILLKEITINTAQPGRYRITWEMKNLASAGTVTTRFYVNNIAISAPESMDSNVWQTKLYSYDVDLAVNDRLQIWGLRTIAETCFVRYFRINYDWCISRFSVDGTNRVLVTALPITDIDLLDFTNTVV
jgi:hypothetical protein